ncbi:OmpA family protein [Steroidobacter sp. S1-65]|uniref:OmpA family protein n=1 Tax=Steroidobacter gossypii TaxID=2805490 RepID=A0ABS1WQS8_9GAMM|nr:OmpA family protein [Steroidobacter gossypii]MBM0103323.1 OmpA family protein [Steroidobacter gossypii]
MVQVFALIVVAFLSLAGAPALAAGNSDAAALAAAVEQARTEQLDVLAPRAFAAAVQASQNATREAERGRSPERVATRVQEGQAALEKARTVADSARQSLAGVIKTRQDALVATAPKFAPEQWQKANDRFLQAMRENESGDLPNAQKRAAEAEVLLREAELIGIKGGILNEARNLIAQADEAKVARYAPRTLESAKRHLAQAEQEIQRNRYDVALPRKLAAQARYDARHATYLAQTIQRVLQQEKDDQAGVEALILSWEEPLQRIASDMELDVRFDEGHQGAMKELGEYAQQQAQEVRRLKLEVQDRDEQLASLNNQLKRIESRLGGESQERIALQRQVDAQARLRANIAAIEASFTADEARVYRQGGDVIVSLLGINFPSGRSTIDGSSAVLMQKVQKALALFPDASVVIEGHTDANGSDSANLLLSQDRADAVKQYLVTQFGANAEKVSSIGYGEARPVATNETAAGRARNRRIDLVINVQGTG